MKYFNDITFDERWHKYTLNGKALLSVTKKLKQIQKPFDKLVIAPRVAAKRTKDGLYTTTEQVIKEWDDKGKHSRDIGNSTHEWIMMYWLGGGTEIDDSISQQIKAFKRYLGDVKWSYGEGDVECVIGDAELGLGGTVDFIPSSSKIHHIVDWKTGKFDIVSKYKLLAPFNDLSSSKLNTASLQLSLYRIIIEKNTPHQLGDSYLVHLGIDGNYEVHIAIDYRERLLNWLNNEHPYIEGEIDF